MRQVRYVAPRQVEVVDRASPAVAGSDALVTVEACGVCGSDIASYMDGHYVRAGQVMGHESVGTVRELGPDARHLDVGRRVAICPLRACGSCWYCRTGRAHICGSTAVGSVGYGADGAFADALLIRDDAGSRQLVGIREATPTEDAVWAEPLAVALHALDRAAVGPGSRALVVGAGPIGLALVAAARAGGLEVEVVEPRTARREAALRLGAVVAWAPEQAPGPTDAEPVDVVLDASGVVPAISAAVRRLRAGGVAVLVGLGDGAVDDAPLGVTVRGAFAFTAQDFVRATRLIDGQTVSLAGAVSHRFALEDTGQAIATAAEDPAALKVIVEP